MQASQEPEHPWHFALLLAILLIAACLRIYSLDTNSLSSGELANVSMCNISSWFKMAARYSMDSGITPLYPSILCQFTKLTSMADFFIRLPSVLAGLAAIFFVYLLGRDLASPTTGLIAAALLAAAPQVVVTDRLALVYPFLTLWLVAHHYCFTRLLFSTESSAAQPLHITHQGTWFNLEAHWQPGFPGNTYCLAGFWGTGILAFYTSPMALLLLASEFAWSVLTVRRLAGGRHPERLLLGWLWLPVLVGLAPWLPRFWGYHDWIWQGNLFGIQKREMVESMFTAITPHGWRNRGALAILGIIAAAAYPWAWMKNRRTVNWSYFIYSIWLLVISVTSSLLILPAAFQSFFFYWWIFLLLVSIGLANPVAALANRLHIAATVLVILSILYAQIDQAIKDKFYLRGGDADFRLAARLVQEDSSFLSSGNPVYTSYEGFRHYLDQAGVTVSNIQLLDENGLRKVEAASTRPHDFYFLEFQPYDQEMAQDSALYTQLTGRYTMLCQSKLPWIRVVKFSGDATASAGAGVDCRTHLTLTPTLK